MFLSVDRQTFGLTSHLAPDALGNKAYMQTPAQTPWRTVVVSDRAADILSSQAHPQPERAVEDPGHELD